MELGELLLSSFSLPTVYAQMGARRGDFACVTAKVAAQSYHALWVLDVPQSKLYALYPVDASTNRLSASAPRDLAKDFE